MTRERVRWICHIKRIRKALGLDPLAAERLALHSPYWQRWLERQVNSDSECRDMALAHISRHGPASLLEREGDHLKVSSSARA